MKIILILLFLSDFWLIKIEKCKKELKKDKWRVNANPKRCQNFSMSKDKKKEIEPIFTK